MAYFGHCRCKRYGELMGEEVGQRFRVGTSPEGWMGEPSEITWVEGELTSVEYGKPYDKTMRWGPHLHYPWWLHIAGQRISADTIQFIENP